MRVFLLACALLSSALAQYVDPLVGLLAPANVPQNLYTIRGPIYVEPSSLQPPFYQQQSIYGQQQGYAVGPPVVGPPVVGPPVVGPPMVGPPMVGPPVVGSPYMGQSIISPSPYNPYAPSYPNQLMYDEQQDEVSPQTRRLNTNIQSGIQQIGQGNMNLQGNIQQVNRRSQTQPLQASRTFRYENNQNQRNGLDQADSMTLLDEGLPGAYPQNNIRKNQIEMTRSQIIARGQQEAASRAAQLLDDQMQSLLRGQMMNDQMFANPAAQQNDYTASRGQLLQDPVQALLRGQQLNDQIYGSPNAQLNDPIFGYPAQLNDQIYGSPSAQLNDQVYGYPAQLNDPIYGNSQQLNDQMYGLPAQQNDQIYGGARGQLQNDQIIAYLRGQQQNDQMYGNPGIQLNDQIPSAALYPTARSQQMQNDQVNALLRGQMLNDQIPSAARSQFMNNRAYPAARGQQMQNDQVNALLRGQMLNDQVYGNPAVQLNDPIMGALRRQLDVKARRQLQNDQVITRGQLQQNPMQVLAANQLQSIGRDQTQGFGIPQSMSGMLQSFENQQQRRQSKGYLADEEEQFDEANLMITKKAGEEGADRRSPTLSDEQDDDPEEQNDFNIDIYADKTGTVKILQR